MSVKTFAYVLCWLSPWFDCVETSEPAPQGLVQLRDRVVQRVAARAASFLADGVLEFLKALPSRPVFLALEFVT